MAKNRHPDREPGVRRRGYTIVIALVFFASLGGLPAILSALHLKINAAPPTSSDGIKLLGAPQALKPVQLPLVARPVAPALPTATFPTVSESEEAAAVATEDNRLRTMLHDSFRIFQPKILTYRHSLPTLLLTSGTHTVHSGGVQTVVPGEGTYTAADLIRDGAMVRLPRGGALLVDNVFVSSGARLDLSSSDVGALYLDNSPRGSASIVAWGGTLDFRGTSRQPLTVQGWDEAAMTPARDTGNGRPYIREVAGRMTFENARVSGLGFWSGRTGGVAWTGLSTHFSNGGAIGTTFTGNTYGVFVTRGRYVRFLFDLFESNELDGLHIHRGTVGASASYSAAVRNGANGFHVDRATQRTVLLHDVSQHNATNGFLVDGRPLVISASASGAGVTPGSGTRIENSAALGNERTGILIEGGNRTVLESDEVCAKLTGIALRLGASNVIVDGNDVRCGPRTGLRVGPAAPGALVFGNAVSGARIAVLVTSPGGSVEIDKSLITLARVFGISVRGVDANVFGKDNVISGIGFRAVDSRAEATPPRLSGSNTANWAFARKGTVLTYLEFHPLALLWLSIAFLVIAGGLWTRRRRAPAHPYMESTRWYESAADLGPVPVPVGATAGARAAPAAARAQPSPASGTAAAGLAAAGAPAGLAPAGAPFGLAAADEQVGTALGAVPIGLAAYGAQAGPAADDAQAGLAAHGAPVSPGQAATPVTQGPGGVPSDPLWPQKHDARPGEITPYRGPFEPASADAARLDGGHLDGGHLDPPRPDDGGALGSRRREDARLESPRLDGGRVDGGRVDGGRRDRVRLDSGWWDDDPLDPGRRNGSRPDDRHLDPGRADGARRDGIRFDPLGLDDRRLGPDNGRRGGGLRDNGLRDGSRRDPARPESGRSGDARSGGARSDSGRSDSGRSDSGRSDSGRSDSGRSDSGQRDGGQRDGGSLNGGRRDPVRRDGARRDGGGPDPLQLDRGRPDPLQLDSRRRDPARWDDERLDPVPLDPGQADPARLEEARPYVGHPEGHGPPSRQGPSEPLDSTKPLPQVSDRQ